MSSGKGEEHPGQNTTINHHSSLFTEMTMQFIFCMLLGHSRKMHVFHLFSFVSHPIHGILIMERKSVKKKYK